MTTVVTLRNIPWGNEVNPRYRSGLAYTGLNPITTTTCINLVINELFLAFSTFKISFSFQRNDSSAMVILMAKQTDNEALEFQMFYTFICSSILVAHVPLV